MKSIRLSQEMNDEEADKLAGLKLDESHYDQLVEEDTIVYKPNGEVLLIFKKNAILEEYCQVAHKNLRDAAVESNNRGIAGGILDETLIGREVGKKDKFRYKPILKDGTVSKTNYANPVNSGIIGYYDRYPRIPYCRLTAFNLNKPKQFTKSMPFIQAVDQVFKTYAPDRYNKQLEIVKQTSKDFVISNTAFTTITINRNWQTAVHKDVGDYKQGFGVMSAFRAGHYSGGYLVFPKYKVAVNMCTGDVLLADVHEWHGNTKIEGKTGQFERLSCVFYYREKMHECEDADKELERAKRYGKGKI